jgi:hypothetical protein
MAPADTAIEIESENTESEGSGSDDGGINDVIRLLDSRLLSVLNDHLDLAARLLPEIHDLLDDEDEFGTFMHANLGHQKGIIHSTNQGLADHRGSFETSPFADLRYEGSLSHPKIQALAGNQQASGGSPSDPGNDNTSSGSSLQKRAHDSGGSKGNGEGSGSKRARREPDRDTDDA